MTRRILVAALSVIAITVGWVPALMAQAPPTAQQRDIRALIIKLGDDSFNVREQASTDLVAMGQPALDELRNLRESSAGVNDQAVIDALQDPEVRRRMNFAIDTLHNNIRMTDFTQKSLEEAARRGQVGALDMFTPYDNPKADSWLEKLEDRFLAHVFDPKDKPDVTGVGVEVTKDGKVIFTLEVWHKKKKFEAVFEAAQDGNWVRITKLVSLKAADGTPELPPVVILIMSLYCALLAGRDQHARQSFNFQHT